MVDFQKPTISKLATDSSCELTREKLGRKKSIYKENDLFLYKKRSKSLISDKLVIKKVVMKKVKTFYLAPHIGNIKWDVPS